MSSSTGPKKHNPPVTRKELDAALSRYYHMIAIYGRLLRTIHDAFRGDQRWFVFSERLARKHLIHCKSVCLHAADTFVYDDEAPKQDTQFMDIPGLFANIRIQADNYAVLYHIFFDDADWEIKRLRFDLWQLDATLDRLQEHDPVKASDEKAVRKLIAHIQANHAYVALTPQEKHFVLKDNADIKKVRANWKFLMEGERVSQQKPTWKAIFLNAGLKGEIFETAHAFFSMYVHSNFLSVMHVTSLTQERAIIDKHFAVTFSSFLIAFAIDDFCYKFSEAKTFADQLTPTEKGVIQSFLTGGRATEKIHYFK
jgi:hypothetical protein